METEPEEADVEMETELEPAKTERTNTQASTDASPKEEKPNENEAAEDLQTPLTNEIMDLSYLSTSTEGGEAKETYSIGKKDL